MAKYTVEYHINGKEYKNAFRSTYKKSMKKGYAYANKKSNKIKSPWTFIHIGKVEKKRGKGLPF